MTTRTDVDVLVVGAGFAGAVMAERLAEGYGLSCLVLDRRDHLAGNAHDTTDAAGVLVHRYGPHWFRTNSDRVRDYLSHFTEWHPVTYRALSWTAGRYWSFPINLETYEQLVGRPATSEEMAAALESWRVPCARPRNSEELVLSQVGPVLYEKFYLGYTMKQWRRHPRELHPSVCGRIPVRTDRDDRYLTESFQALPARGYTALFERLLRHPKIEVRLGAEWRDVARAVRYRHLVYTGRLDDFYEERFGPLPYRSLRWEHETLPQEWFQPAMQVNFPNDHAFTRILEYKHATGQVLPVTTIAREYPDDWRPGKDPFYAMPTPEAQALFAQYAALAEREAHVSFVGRLPTYTNYNMDQVVGMALAEADRVGPGLVCP